MATTSISQAIKGLIPQSNDILTGTLLSKSPLSVRLQDNSGLTLGKAVLVCTKQVKEDLEVGDEVIILSINSGNRYIILGGA